jgi:hypothetical protein
MAEARMFEAKTQLSELVKRSFVTRRNWPFHRRRAYRSVSVSPVWSRGFLAELMSASPVLQSFLLILAAVKPSASNRNCPCFSLSQPRGPLHLLIAQFLVRYAVPVSTPTVTLPPL